MTPESTTLLRGLYAITPEDPLLPRLAALVEAALQGGVRLLQYRNKTAPPPLRRAQAAEMLRLCRAYDALLIINDDLPLALEINADGVHLGRDDHCNDLTAARQALGGQKYSAFPAMPISRAPKPQPRQAQTILPLAASIPPPPNPPHRQRPSACSPKPAVSACPSPPSAASP